MTLGHRRCHRWRNAARGCEQVKEKKMIRQHPVRVLSVIFLVAVSLLFLSAPGANDKSGVWYYLSAFGWFGFLVTVLIFLVVAAIAATSVMARRRRPSNS
jgi:hypothetical protein